MALTEYPKSMLTATMLAVPILGKIAVFESIHASEPAPTNFG